MSWVRLAPLLVLATACEWGEPREDVPGDYLGDFSVTAELLESTCGAGALGAPDHWEFDIRLSRQGRELYWVNGREVIPGTIDDATGLLSFDTRVEVEIEPAEPPRTGCSVNRFDSARATVDGKDLDIRGFEGTLAYEYAPTEQSDCLELVLGGTLAQLPCQISYDMSGARTRSPDSAP